MSNDTASARIAPEIQSEKHMKSKNPGNVKTLLKPLSHLDRDCLLSAAELSHGAALSAIAEARAAATEAVVTREIVRGGLKWSMIRDLIIIASLAVMLVLRVYELFYTPYV